MRLPAAVIEGFRGIGAGEVCLAAVPENRGATSSDSRQTAASSGDALGIVKA